ncbi:aminoglycoside phosphotransferase family protein [Aspergillus lucknowensis]|uniref:Altered inheritance of mitochondria protein 9, mitochondrial n=1 Tax=Aspergillus lucknowensis TaxID=176173 RepID=A0ABR4LLP8_9EURO
MRSVVSLFMKQKRMLSSPPGHSANSLNRSFHTNCNTNDDWFRYTRGRFLFNEAQEMSIRSVKFNMNELVKRAADSVGLTSAQCARVEKFPDGMFNKTFLFTMQDGTQVVGKVPNPNAGRAHYTTASEVATMDFARNELRTPVPKVLAWSSKAEDNLVGAEYIIMEKVAGIQLSKVWPTMGIKERFELVKTICGYQKAWMSIPFTQYGSLYYSSDLEDSEGCALIKGGLSLPTHRRFAVGPSTGREFLDDGRIALEFDRGPWNGVEQYKSAVGLREIACVQNMARLPRSQLSLYGPGTYCRSRSKKIAALESYLRLVKYFLPTDPSIMTAFLWHPDLHAENIFVHPERPAEVLGIIDWQSSELLPLFDHARQPYFLDYDGPPSTGIDPPAFPEGFDKLDPAKKAEAQDLYLKMSLSALYRRFTYSNNITLFNAMEFRQTTSFEMLLLAQNLLIDGEALYRLRCLDLEKE